MAAERAKAEAYLADINKQFSTKMGIDEADKDTRESMLKEYSLQQKLALIKALAKAEASQDDPVEYLSKLIDEGATVESLTKVEKKILDAKDSWLEDFGSAGACEWLVDMLVAALHKPSTLTAKKKSEEDIDQIDMLVRVLSALVNSTVGDMFVELPGLFKHLTLTFDYVDSDGQVAVLELFTAFVLNTENTAHVLEAFVFYYSLAPDNEKKFFERVRAALELKTAYFVLVNTIITTLKEARQRADVRARFLPHETLAMMKDDELDEDMAEQLSIYEEDLARDAAVVVDAGDQLDLTSALRQTKGTAGEVQLKAILDGLSKATGKDRAAVWKLITRLVKHMAESKSGNHADALATFLKKEYHTEGRLLAEAHSPPPPPRSAFSMRASLARGSSGGVMEDIRMAREAAKALAPTPAPAPTGGPPGAPPMKALPPLPSSSGGPPLPPPGPPGGPPMIPSTRL